MNLSLKHIARATLLAGLTFSAPSGYASGVFKCVDDQGNTTFSFTSCPSLVAPVVASATNNIRETDSVKSGTDTSRRVQLARLDASIQSVQEELDQLKQGYELSLSQQTSHQRTDGLTGRFDRETAALFAELARLKKEKSRVFGR